MVRARLVQAAVEARVTGNSGYGGEGKQSAGPRQGWLKKRLGRGGDGVNEKPTPPLFL